MMTRKDFLIGAASTAATASAIDGESIEGGWGRARGLLGGAYMGCMLAQQSKTYTTRDYVQDGLIGMWDGIENAGWGTHDANATVWTDLIGTFHKTSLSGFVWTDDSFSSNGNVIGSAHIPENYSGAQAFWNSYNAGVSATFEYVGKSANDDNHRYKPWNTIFTKANFTVYGNGNIYNASGAFAFASGTSWGKSHTYHSAVWTSDGGILYKNGTQFATHSTPWSSQSYPKRDFINNQCSNGFINCVRIYNRALTAAEIAANYAVDKARFGLP